MTGYAVIIGNAIGRTDEPTLEPQPPRRTKEDEMPSLLSHAAADEPWTLSLQGNDPVENNVVDEEESPIEKLEALPANNIGHKEESFSEWILSSWKVQTQPLRIKPTRKEQMGQLVYVLVLQRTSQRCCPRHLLT
jgi:hypothetical protein